MKCVENKTDAKMTCRRSKKVKNLEEEVEFILSQDESDDDVNSSEDIEEILPKTPSRSNKIKEIPTPAASQAVLQEILQTPRRSCRKSIKPTQDYDDIVNKSCNRSNRSARKQLMATEEEVQEDAENTEDPTSTQPKWTPAKVGRVSQKRGRKSRRTTKGKQNKGKKESIGAVYNLMENLDEQIEQHKEMPENLINLDKSQKMEDVPEKGNAVIVVETEKEENILQNIEKSYEHCKKTIEIKDKIDVSYQEVKKSSETCKETIGSEQETFETVQNSNRDNLNPSETFKTVEAPQDELEIENNMNTSYQVNAEHDEITKKLKQRETSFVNPSESLAEFMNLEEQINIEDNDEPLHLIQEDSEDVKEIKEKNDISTMEISGKPSKLEKTAKLNGSFGCYLKSKEININDLGLNPLKDEDPQEAQEEEDTAKINKAEIDLTELEDMDEMPSLIVCDEDDDDEVLAKEVTKKLNETFDDNKTVVDFEQPCMASTKSSQKEFLELSNHVAKEDSAKLNDTFEANDSVIIMEDICKSSLKQDTMESLQISDDEGETMKKAPLHNKLSISKQSGGECQQQETSLKLPSTPQQLATLKLPETPKQSTKAFRFPTPYRNRQNFKFNKEVKQSDEKDPVEKPINNSWLPKAFTTLGAKDIILRGIRKRSLSLCIDGSDAKRQKLLDNTNTKFNQEKIVSFYSPANRTTIIDDLDMIIAKSLKKQKRPVNKDVSNKFVTTRRKRSMSVDESLISSTLMSRLPRPIPSQITPSKTKASTSKPLARTKLPNFAALHQAQFQKMENLVDHVNRKQERSKLLINSATKIRPASAQKNILNNKQNEKPKAL